MISPQDRTAILAYPRSSPVKHFVRGSCRSLMGAATASGQGLVSVLSVGNVTPSILIREGQWMLQGVKWNQQADPCTNIHHFIMFAAYKCDKRKINETKHETQELSWSRNTCTVLANVNKHRHTSYTYIGRIVKGELRSSLIPLRYIECV